ncbi:MAG: alternative ribosome rescue aminoacyl-tRNA hydrolase ArfB [Candidatus Aminicenantes bacterium]|jgi:ribosome-associated protein
MIYITKNISIDENEIHEDFVRASGPGGQNVNKVSTAVQLRFDVKNSASLPEEVRHRLMKIAGHRLTAEGVLIIDARRFRHQERNRQDALNRLKNLIRKAAQKPKKRLKTQPSLASRQKRLESKRRHSQKKQLRRQIRYSD